MTNLALEESSIESIGDKDVCPQCGAKLSLWQKALLDEVKGLLYKSLVAGIDAASPKPRVSLYVPKRSSSESP